jgi:hypothetical protein
MITNVFENIFLNLLIIKKIVDFVKQYFRILNIEIKLNLITSLYYIKNIYKTLIIVYLLKLLHYCSHAI